MDTDPLGTMPPLITGKNPVRFGDLAGPRVRLAWRNDVLVPGRTILDRKKRPWLGRAQAGHRRRKGSAEADEDDRQPGARARVGA